MSLHAVQGSVLLSAPSLKEPLPSDFDLSSKNYSQASSAMASFRSKQPHMRSTKPSGSAKSVRLYLRAFVLGLIVLAGLQLGRSLVAGIFEALHLYSQAPQVESILLEQESLNQQLKSDIAVLKSDYGQEKLLREHLDMAAKGEVLVKLH